MPSSCDRLILEVDPFTIKLGALVSTGGETFGNMSPKKKTKKIAKKNAEKSRATSSEISNTSYCAAFLILITFCLQVVCFSIVSGEDELENKYRRSVLDVAILQDHLGEQHPSFPSSTSRSAFSQGTCFNV